MAISPNAYATYSENSDYTNPIIWSSNAEKYIYEQNPFQAYAINDSRFLNAPGKQGNYTLDTAYSMGLLTEGISTPISDLEFEQVTITFYGYGDAKQVTDEETAYGFDYIKNDIKYGALGAMAENRASVIVTELMTTSSTGLYPNGHASGTILAADTFSTSLMNMVSSEMEQTQARKCNVIFIHPKQAFSLRELEQFTDASVLGSDRVIKSGMIGDYLGIDILVSNHITTATENVITVYKSIALGRRPFIFAQKRVFEFNRERESMRDRGETFSWWEMFGTTILHDDSIVIITTAGGY